MEEPQNKSTTTSPKVQFKLDTSGQLHFDGELTEDNSELVEKLIQQAEYYRSKASQAQSETTNAQLQLDGIMMTFLGCVLSAFVFLSYVVISSISSHFGGHYESQNNTYRVEQ